MRSLIFLLFFQGHNSLANSFMCETDTPTQDELRVIEGNLRHGSLTNRLDNVMEAISLGANTDAPGDDNMTALMLAAQNNNIRIAKSLLEHRASCSERNIYGQTSLHIATIEGHLDMVSLLLKKSSDRTDVNRVDSEGRTPLHLAARLNQVDILKLFIRERKKELNVNMKSADGETALIIAAKENNGKILDVLLEAGANPLIKDDMFNKRALYFAGKTRAVNNIEKLAKATLKWKPTSVIAVKALNFVKELRKRRQARFNGK